MGRDEGHILVVGFWYGNSNVCMLLWTERLQFWSCYVKLGPTFSEFLFKEFEVYKYGFGTCNWLG